MSALHNSTAVVIDGMRAASIKSSVICVSVTAEQTRGGTAVSPARFHPVIVVTSAAHVVN